MLADARRVGALGQALAVEGDRQRRHADRLAAGARLQQAAGGVEVRVVEQVPGLGDRRERHADRFQPGGELLLRVLARELVEARNEPGALLRTLAVGSQTGILKKIDQAEVAAERLPLRVGHDADEKSPAARGLE